MCIRDRPRGGRRQQVGDPGQGPDGRDGVVRGPGKVHRRPLWLTGIRGGTRRSGGAPVGGVGQPRPSRGPDRVGLSA
eukprot:8475229-Alexandrium_andersonii.AAC.1